MSPKQLTLLAATLAIVASPLSIAAPIVIDGDLNDWGVVVADGNESNSLNLRSDIGLIGFHRDDQNDSAGDSGFLGPHYGGQNYDAEFLGVALQDTTLYIAIATGQRPDNGFSRYSPGDILILTDTGFFGIEVGGGAGGGSGSAITEGAGGSTYILNGSGYTTAHNLANPAQVAGSVWSNVDWILDPITHSRAVQFAVNGGSQQVGTADYVYTRNSLTNQHATIELAMDTSFFGDNLIGAIFWAPSCDNDELLAWTSIKTTDDVHVQGQVPEPSAIALLGLGLSALGAVRRRGRSGRGQTATK